MKLTTNYSLKKPEGSDVVNIDDFNYNADIIDNAIQEIKNTSSTNKTNISSLQAKVNNGQNFKLTEDDGAYKIYSDSTNIDNILAGNCDILNATGTLPGNLNPSDNNIFIECKRRSDDYIRQICYDVRSLNSWQRLRFNGTWSEWREL